MMDRRKFFKVCAVVLGSGAFPIACSQNGGDPEAAAPGVGTGDQTFSKSLFDEIPSTTFSVSHDVYGAIDMELTEVNSGTVSAETEQFSVCLTGPTTPLFNEGSYNMYNETLGYIDLYLQPGDSPAGEQKYRAVFSLLNA